MDVAHPEANICSHTRVADTVLGFEEPIVGIVNRGSEPGSLSSNRGGPDRTSDICRSSVSRTPNTPVHVS